MNMCLKGKKYKVSIQLDTCKAYDKIEQGFLEVLLRKLHFNTRSVTLLMKCVISVSYSLIVNGSQMPSFKHKEGHRQGDPLLSYIFILCAKAFSALLSKADGEGPINGLSIARNSPKVSHLFFADDSFTFMEVIRSSISKLQEILMSYERAFGQKVNLKNIAMVCSPNTTEDVKREA